MIMYYPKNFVFAEGRIAELKIGKGSNGLKYCTFLLDIEHNAKEDVLPEDARTGIIRARVFVFNAKLIEYLQRVKAKNNAFASVYGRIGSSRLESTEGKVYYTNNVVAKDIHLIKTTKTSENDE